MKSFSALTLVLFCGISANANADPIVIRIPPDSPGQSGGSWGHDSAGATVFGQTFKPPNGATVLDGFTFYIWHVQGSPVQFRAFVMEWEGTRAIGPPLFESEVMTVTHVEPDAPVFQPIAVDTPDLSVTEGTSYVALLSAFGDGDPPGTTVWLLNLLNPYPHGGWVVTDVGGDNDLLRNRRWDFLEAIDVYDLGFEMRFRDTTPAAPVPEPGTWGLIVTGLLTLARRRQPWSKKQ